MHRRSRFPGLREHFFALLVPVMAFLAGCGPFGGTGPTAPPCNLATQWQAPANNVQLDDLSMVAPDEGWAVGGLTAQWPPTSPDLGPSGVIYHLAGGRWQRVPQTYSGAELSTISMDAPNDGWAASNSAMTGMGDHALVLHYHEGHWTPVDIPSLDAVLQGPPGSAGGYLSGISVQMFSPYGGWMFAETNLPRDPTNPATRDRVIILRYAQGVWTPIAAPSVSPTTELFSLSAVSADEAWIVGTDYGHGSDFTTHFARYDAGGWSLWPKAVSGISDGFTMLSPTDGWAFQSGANGGGDNVNVLHYDGTTWAPFSTPDWADQRISLTSGIFAAAPSVTWFLAMHEDGFGNDTSLIEMYAKGQWQPVTWPFGDVQPQRLALATPGELWGIGDLAHQEGCAPAAVVNLAQGVFFHAQQGTWTREVLP